MSQRTDSKLQRPSAGLSIAIFIVGVASMAWLRLGVYPHQLITLTYGLPLIVCLWHRDLRLLWSMFVAFMAMSSYKAFVLIPNVTGAPTQLTQWVMQLTNLILIGGSVHYIIKLLNWLNRQNLELERQNEELRQQSKELERQREELQEQNEELQTLNGEIAQRESMLQNAVRAARDELEVRVEQRTAELLKRSEELRAMASELTLAEQRERQRLAQVLHDGLQQLLAVARLRLNLLERAKPENVQRMASELGELISDAIQVSRSLTAELSPPILREGGLVPALEWLARWMMTKHHLAVDLDVRETVQPVEDMTIMLFQTVRELLFNVVKHSGVREAHVSVTRRDGTLEIIVADEGVGFDPADGRIAGKIGCYGLFSVRERLKLLGGNLEIDSIPGGGSRFIITAPLAEGGPGSEKPSAFMPRKQTVRIQPAVANAEAAGAIQVMIVDDHCVMLQELSMLIHQQPDMKIIGEASSGESAIDLARQVRPAVVLMDISLPGINGIEATRRLHDEFPEMQIIGLSMYEETERAQAMLEAGAAAYMTKNALAEQIVETIRACAGADPAQLAGSTE